MLPSDLLPENFGRPCGALFFSVHDAVEQARAGAQPARWVDALELPPPLHAARYADAVAGGVGDLT